MSRSKRTRRKSSTAAPARKVPVPWTAIAIFAAITLSMLFFRPPSLQVADHGGQNHVEQHLMICGST